MVSEWTSSSFWHQTWRNLLINSRVLIIWINTCTNVRFKKLKMKPLNCIEQVIAEQTCMNGNICNWSFPHWYETFLGKLDFYKCPGFFFLSVDIFIQRPTSDQTTPMVKVCMDKCLIGYMLPLIIEENWSSVYFFRNLPR